MTCKEVVNAIGLNDGITDPLQKVVFHTLRHTFCSWLAMKGVPIFTISELAGHKSVNMTRRYAKLSPDVKRDALQELSSFLFPQKQTAIEPEILSPQSSRDILTQSFHKALLREHKVPLTLSIDADIVQWCKADTRIINAALRSVMEACQQTKLQEAPF